MNYLALKRVVQSKWVILLVSDAIVHPLITTQTTQTILEALRNPKPDVTPTATDKLRLVIVFYLSVPDNAISKEEIAELEKELKAAGANVAAFEYVRR